MAPDRPEKLQAYWATHELDFPAVADPNGALLKRLGQKVNWLRFGRMPALLAIDRDGHIVYQHVGRSMRDLPDLGASLQSLDSRAAES